MKFLILGLCLTLFGCSSGQIHSKKLVTQDDLIWCRDKCGSVEKIDDCIKNNGKLSCSCK